MSYFEEESFDDDKKYRLEVLRELIQLEEALGINDYGQTYFEGVEEDPED